MKYKYIIIVGASLITAFFLFSGLMYYFSKDKCPVGTFPCENSTTCMPQRNWCNGISDCPYGDDELEKNCFDVRGPLKYFVLKTNLVIYSRIILETLKANCDEFVVPSNCVYDRCLIQCSDYIDIPQNLSSNIMIISLVNNSLSHLSREALSRYPEIQLLDVDNNSIVELEKRAFFNQNKLATLDISRNKISKILPGHLIGLDKLRILNANENKIIMADFSDLENSTTMFSINLATNMLTTGNLKLSRLPTLKMLILTENHFQSITEDLLAGCLSLEILGINFNNITNIDENAFRNLQQLSVINLAHNKIVTIPLNLFLPVNNLLFLGLGRNPIVELPKTFFTDVLYVKNIRSLDLQNIDMEYVDPNAFDILLDLEYIHFKKFHYCMTYAPKVRWCKPNTDGVSSLSHLLNTPMLRIAVWSISLITCICNILVLWGRYTARNDNRVLSINIRNLAVADMLMGIYLFIIAIEDERFRDRYNEVAHTWMSSWGCAILGTLAMTSSEVSVLILSFMSVERFIVITTPFTNYRKMTSQTAILAMIIIWIIGITLSFIPVIYWKSSTRFYGVNGMCFPLHIDDPYMIGWKYSAFVFVGINLLGFTIIGYAYAAMFINIWKTHHATTLSDRDFEYALRFFLIVLTDAACWLPIIALKILAMMKYPVSPHLHAWVMIFILPINSAINPMLYTFTTSKFRERFNKNCFEKLRRNRSMQYPMQDLQAATITTNRTICTTPT